ncbi:MAG: hypothetical protein OSB62_06520 [Alphaproteobacteria bacterium]|nr:hypothetical protein [Alphaproteobacteria bacterium]
MFFQWLKKDAKAAWLAWDKFAKTATGRLGIAFMFGCYASSFYASSVEMSNLAAGVWAMYSLFFIWLAYVAYERDNTPDTATA